MSSHSEHGAHGGQAYIYIWIALVGLFLASVGFSAFSSVIVGVVFAFFIAIIKALMVASYFMHLNIEPRWTWAILGMALLTVFVMWLGIAPDVMEMNGVNWSKDPENFAPLLVSPGTGH